MTESSDEKHRQGLDERRLAIRQLFETLPDRHEDRYPVLAAMHRAFHEELAQAMSPINDYIARQPQQSYAERTRLASHINETLRAVGLAVRCPKTGEPAVLLADRQDADHPDVSRFRVEIRDATGRAQRPFSTRGPLPPLSLVPDESRKYFWARRRAQRDGPQGP